MPQPLARLIARLRGLSRRRGVASELDEELQFHLAQEVEANRARGMTDQEARRVALRDLGGLTQTREAVRDVHSLWIEAVWRDVRYAVRALRASPAFTAIAVAVLALSVGVSASVYSVVDAVILRGLPFSEAHRLVAVGEQGADQSPGALNLVAPQNFLDWRARQDVFTGLAAAAYAEISLKGTGEAFPENLLARRVTANFFEVLRAAPMIGRPFTVENEVAGREHVAVISHRLWQRRFAGAPNVLGKRLPGQLASFEIVGVMPPAFSYPVGAAEPVEVWVPYVVGPDERVRGNDFGYYLQVIGRLRDGVSIERAQARMDQITAELAAETPRWFTDRSARVEFLQDYLTRGVRSWMLMLLGAVGCVLLIACVNLANLILARGTTRQRELGVRAALGASRGALARVLLTESLLLSVAGALLGGVLAWLAVGFLRASLPPELPRVALIAVNWRVLTVTMTMAVVIGLALGMAPVFQFVRPAAVAMMRQGQRTNTGDRRSARLRASLIVTEVALAMMLLVGGGLFLSSFARVASIDLGFDYRNVLTVRLRPLVLPPNAPPGPSPLLDVLESARAMPGVETAALAGGGLPLRGDLMTHDFTIPGSVPPRDGDIAMNQVSPDYFRVLRIPLLRGRAFTAADRPGSPPVVILNRRAAGMFFGGDAAIGQVMNWRRQDLGERTVVGIVGDIRFDGPENDARPQAFVPLAQTQTSAATLVLRTTPDAQGVLAGIHAAVAAEYPEGSAPPVHIDVQTLERHYSNLVAQRRLNMWLLTVFGVLGLGIAVIGIYGVMSYIVAQRRQEIGIRMALGALPSAILWSVIGRTSRYLSLGLILGITAAWALSGTVSGLLFGVNPHDAGIYAAVAILLSFVGFVAALVPARRAARVDPLEALRLEV